MIYLNFVLNNLSEDNILRICTFYKDFQSDNTNDYVRFFAKADYVTVTVYTSNKAMFQGEDAKAEYDMWVTMLSYHETKPTKESLKASQHPSFKDYFYPAIGSDEVGTGDFFGPMVVCAFYLKNSDVLTFKALDIKDSKNISDEKIRVLGKQIKDIGTYSVLTLHNEKYNRLIKSGFNMNKIKAYLHNKAILNVLFKTDGAPEVIVDQFTPERNYFRYLNQENKVYRNITFLTKAESRYACVALASIMARYAFLQHMDKLSKDLGVTLRKGASHLVDEQAASLIETHGEAFMERIAKCNFKTFDKAKKLR